MRDIEGKRFTGTLAAVVAAGVLAQGCASAPPSRATAPSECRLLAMQMQQAAGELAAAQQKSRDAWKAAIPVVVVAQAASGKAEANSAAARLGGLKAESARLGCPQAATGSPYR